jgi:ureidoacrylate peracid hydrolase
MHRIEIPQKILDANLRRRGRVHAIERLDPRRTALVVVDMQNAWLEPGAACEIPEARSIVANVNRLARATRAAGGIVAWTQHSWVSWPHFYESFGTPDWRDRVMAASAVGSHGHAIGAAMDVAADDLRVNKTRPSAFIQGSSDLEARLRSRGIDTLIITGTLTNACCESSARDAVALDFRVVFVADATATRTDEEHNAALINVMQYVADLRVTDEVVDLLARGAGA